MFVLSADDSELSTKEAFDQRLESMREDGTYGDHLELQAWCNLTLRDIVIIQSNFIYFMKPSNNNLPNNREKQSPPPVLDSNQETPREVRKRKRDERTKLLTSIDSADEQKDTMANIETKSIDGPLYIIYHDWEHYSSARNLSGPHSGLPQVHMVRLVLI